MQCLSLFYHFITNGNKCGALTPPPRSYYYICFNLPDIGVTSEITVVDSIGATLVGKTWRVVVTSILVGKAWRVVVSSTLVGKPWRVVITSTQIWDKLM